MIGRFDREYSRAVDDVMRFWSNEMQCALARHNAGWRCGVTDFAGYLHASVKRFRHAYEVLQLATMGSLCDVGGFWGVWPLTLLRLGVERVVMTEALQYYGSTFDPLFGFLRSEGVAVIDFDPFGEDPELRETFDVVTLMAVLEHYPHSPRRALERISNMLGDSSWLLIEVPNIAYWAKRADMLRGVSPLPPLADVWVSDEPFTGHHREYSRADLRELARLAGLDVIQEYELDYSCEMQSWLATLKSVLRDPLAAYLRTRPDSKEVLAMVCTKA